MKLQICAITTLLILSSSASANWFDGFNKSKAVGNAFSGAAANTNTAATHNANALSNTQGRGATKGSSNANMNFAFAFKAKSNTDVNTTSHLKGKGQAVGTTMANANMAGNGSNAANTSTLTNGTFAPLDFNPSYAPATPAIQIEQKTTAPQDYIKLKAMWEAQRKQAEDMLKRIKAAQESVALQK